MKSILLVLSFLLSAQFSSALVIKKYSESQASIKPFSLVDKLNLAVRALNKMNSEAHLIVSEVVGANEKLTLNENSTYTFKLSSPSSSRRCNVRVASSKKSGAIEKPGQVYTATTSNASCSTYFPTVQPVTAPWSAYTKALNDSLENNLIANVVSAKASMYGDVTLIKFSFKE